MTPFVTGALTRRYADLVQLGRSRLPGFAPEWTDHNAHDPGITLMELLAWVAEAQLYSVSRSRTDERAAYAAMFDVVSGGTRPAQGVIWPDRGDSSSPWSSFAESVVLRASETIVRMIDHDDPAFRPTHDLLWVPARIAKLESWHADGRTEDLTRANERAGPGFAPFGDLASARDRLVMSIEVRGNVGLFPQRRRDALGARLALGVRAQDGAQDVGEAAAVPGGPLEVTLVAGTDRYVLPIVEDSTQGLLRNGAVILDLDSVPQAPTRFTLEIRAAQGSVVSPRLLRIEPCVLPITQQRRVDREAHPALLDPDQSFLLDAPGLCFGAGEVPPLDLLVDDSNTMKAWSRCARLPECGPGDKVFELDEGTGRITFGNGINGALPPPGSTIRVSYRVSDGARGNIARNRKWRVTGFDGAFGVNPDGVLGGSDRADDIAVRRTARHDSRDKHALVSTSDIVEAAQAIPLLGVARAWILPQGARSRSGTVTLVVLRKRAAGAEPPVIPEPRRWLQAIQRTLAPRMPLGTRLSVVGPRYIDFRVRASIVPERGRDPAMISEAVAKELQARLALVPAKPGQPVRPTGVPLSHYEVSAWIRGVDGVAALQSLTLVRDRSVVDEIRVPAHGLPRLVLQAGDITVRQSTSGSAA